MAYLNPDMVFSRMAAFVLMSRRLPVDEDSDTIGPMTKSKGGNSTYVPPPPSPPPTDDGATVVVVPPPPSRV